VNKAYVLDTGALIELHDKPWGRLMTQVVTARADQDVSIWIPVVVLAELGQSTRLYNKRMEKIGSISDFAMLTNEVANCAAEGLRAVTRNKCRECSGFIGPSLVDAIVMAFAHQYFSSGSEAIVYTSDRGDMELLRDACFEGVTLIDC
jgi:predicted nucleic acid-binding protein